MHCSHACSQHGTRLFCMERWVVFTSLCCACPRCELYFGWFPLLGFTHFSLTYQHNVKGQSKIVLFFIFSPICPCLSLKLFFCLALWWWMEAFCWTEMHVGRSWVWLSSRWSFSVFHTFLLVINSWQNGPKVLENILSYFVLLHNKRKMETSAALGSIVP